MKSIAPVDASSMLTAVKVLHTAVWLVMASSILVLPVAALRKRFKWAFGLSALVLLECAVLAANRGRCPLTDVAARYTAGRAANFDIYLPLWLAAWNKLIVGLLFAADEFVVLWRWFRRPTLEPPGLGLARSTPQPEPAKPAEQL